MTDEKTAFLIAHPELAARVRQDNDLIIQNWEIQVRQRIPAARMMPRLALRDSLPVFLDRLADTLEAKNKSETIKEAAEVGKKHGGERARFSTYSVSEVLSEYWLLRTVVFETLEGEAPMPRSARNLILFAVDEGIRNAVEEFANERTRVLEQSNRDLEHFAAVAAHDLKSPLATISGFLEVIEEGVETKVEEDIIGFIKTTKRAAGQMSVMIDKLLEYSSVGKHPEFSRVSIAEILDRVQTNLKTSIEKTNAKIVVGTMPTVEGEPALLCMLFQNLISNAIKFKDGDPPEILISVEENQATWLFSVTDNGIGFDTKVGDSIFSLFKQFHQSSNYRGFGIGLATARKVVEIHGGEISATSEIGIGSVFYFTLPK